MSKRMRLAAVALVVAAAAVALVMIQASRTNETAQPTAGVRATTPSRPASESPAPVTAPRPPREEPTLIRVVDGKPAGGVKLISVRKGQVIRFSVRSDVADEVHVHGYDLHGDVKAGDQVSFAFPASIDGVFDVELEQRSEPIVRLRVQP